MVSEPRESLPSSAPNVPLRMGPPLRTGDTVALFSPSSHAGRDGAAFLAAASRILADWGLRPLPLPEPQRRHLYLAGTDRERAEEFQRLYCDEQVRALFATRGGYGAARILPLLDAGAIAAAPPKRVVGMSDVSALFTYLHAVAGVGAFHGPALGSPKGRLPARHEQNLQQLREVLFAETTEITSTLQLLHLPAPGTPALESNSAHGVLVGGNLTVLSAGIGTPWPLAGRDRLVFLEDVNEAPYRLDRYLTQLFQSGALDGARGVVFGSLEDCDSESPGLLREMLLDVFSDAPFPVAWGLPAGHGQQNQVLPLGSIATLTWPAASDPQEAILRIA